MRFLFDGGWYMDTQHGWTPLRDGQRPSDVVMQRPDAFESRAPTTLRLSEQAQCDTDEAQGFAQTHRLVADIAGYLGRPVAPTIRQLRGPGGPRPIMLMRRALCVVGRHRGIGRTALATYLGRDEKAITRYTSQARQTLDRDPAFRRLHDHVLAASRDGATCGGLPASQCRGVGPATSEGAS